MIPPPPFTAFLRCKQWAEVASRIEDPTTCFELLGNLQGERDPQAWRLDGRWRENGTAHAYDIVGVLVGRNGDGTALIEPLPEAAGQGKDLTPKKGKAA